MKTKIKIVCCVITAVLLVWLAFVVVDMLRIHSIWRQSEKVNEPFYTLVVDGKIIQHAYTVHFDRYGFDSTGHYVGYDDGRIEIPLLTVFRAFGAEISEAENGVLSIVYRGEKYVIVPERQAMYLADTFYNVVIKDMPMNTNEDGDEYNLLLIWPGKENSYFREDSGECIVDLGSLHGLCLSMGFTFDFNQERGIVFFFSDTKQLFGRSFPAH